MEKLTTNQSPIMARVRLIAPRQQDSSSSSPTINHPKKQIVNNNRFLSIQELCSEVEKGLALYPPELCEEGVNGTYFLKDCHGATLAVFKPRDEEGDSEGNPKRKGTVFLNHYHSHHHDDESSSIPDQDDLPNDPPQLPLRSPLVPRLASQRLEQEKQQLVHGIYPGEGAAREVAAYLLDHHHDHFCGVPPTALVEIHYHPITSTRSSSKSSNTSTSIMGSLQQYMKNGGSAEDCGFTSFPIHEVHKIGLLDILLLNSDRHDGNILFQSATNNHNNNSANNNNTHNNRVLIPIDHGYSLPHSLDSAWFGWLTWPQAKQPFDISSRDFISSLDVMDDIQLWRDHHLPISEDCLLNVRISMTLLKRAFEKMKSEGNFSLITLYDLGVLICRVASLQDPSELELLCQQARHDVIINKKMSSKDAGHDHDDDDHDVMPAGSADPSMDAEEELFFEYLCIRMDRKLDEILSKKKNSMNSTSAAASHMMIGNSPRADRRPIMKALNAHYTPFSSTSPPSSPLLRVRRSSSLVATNQRVSSSSHAMALI